MGKEMMTTWWWSSILLKKHNHICLKIGVSVILLVFALRLLFSQSVIYFPLSNPPLTTTSTSASTGTATSTTSSSANNYDNNNNNNNVEFEPPISNPSSSSQQLQDQISSTIPTERCDLFKGEWVPNPMGPVYTNESCPVVEDHQNCIKNGRPDSDYLYWRWKPRDCHLPIFDPLRFLNAMRNKSFAFIGDSISRNHVQSLLCILSKAERAIEVYHDEQFKSKRWHFPVHNFTLSVIWSPFLIKAAIFEDINGVSTSEIQLYLDIIDDKWTPEYQSFDYVVLSGGKWFLKTAIYWENNSVVGCHYCLGKNLTEVGFEYAYRKALQLVLDFILKNSDRMDMVMLRTSTPDHFENGEWFSGGTCNRTVPFKEGEISLADVDRIMRDIELDEFKKAAQKSLENGMNLKLLDTTFLSLLRPDGHPGPYRQFHPFARDKNAKVQNDCLHWCLPGPIDSWNDLIMEMVLNG